MKKGQIVKLKQPIVEGEIVQTRYNEETEQLEHLVELKDDQGDPMPRWFLESELELLK